MLLLPLLLYLRRGTHASTHTHNTTTTTTTITNTTIVARALVLHSESNGRVTRLHHRHTHSTDDPGMVPRSKSKRSARHVPVLRSMHTSLSLLLHNNTQHTPTILRARMLTHNRLDVPINDAVVDVLAKEPRARMTTRVWRTTTQL